MTKQQVASAAADLVAPILGLVATYFITVIATGMVSKPDYVPVVRGVNDDANTPLVFWYMIFRFVPIVAAVVLSCTLVETVSLSIKKWVNPQYYATRDLLKMLVGRTIPK